MGTKKTKAALVEKSFDKEATDRLWEAVARGTSRDDPRVALALAEGANPNADDWEFKETPLLMAIHQGRVGAARILLAAGADPNRENECDQKPLELAVSTKGKAGQSARFVKLLVAAGAELEGVNARGWTALMSACDAGNKEGAEALLRLGANMEHGDPRGWTPLVTAIYGARDAGGAACLDMMVERGALVTADAVERAQAWGRDEVASRLGAILLARHEREELGAAAEPARPRAARPRAL